MGGARGRAANSKHWFTTSFLYEGRCRKVMLGVGGGGGGGGALFTESSVSEWKI